MALVATQVTKVRLAEQCLEVDWTNGKSSVFDYIWLRDNCSSSFHPNTHERSFDLLSIDEHIQPQQASTDGDTINIDWGNHQSTFESSWLKKHDYNTSSQSSHKETLNLWKSDYCPAQFDFVELIDYDYELLNFLQALETNGLVFVVSVPEQDALERLVARISHLRETNFGKIFEVESKPAPNNQAYTADALPLHTDLPNQELIPGYQLLHCVANRAEGGESLLADGFCAAAILRDEYPDDYYLLSDQAISFRFYDDTCDLVQRKLVISTDDYGNIDQITFNAHIAEPFDLPAKIMRPYYQAYRRFMQVVRSDDLAIRFKLENGSMMIFNNRRVLHGRESFDPNSGYRLLRGCYVDTADVRSKIKVLQKTFRQCQEKGEVKLK